MRKRLTSYWSITFLSLALILGGLIGYANMTEHADAYAGVPVIGQRHGADARAIVSDGTSKVIDIVYVKAGVKTPTSGTAVISGSRCDLAGDLHYAQVNLIAPLTGTAPTLTVLWQNSKDGGATWSNVGTWTTINATVTPATQSQTVADIRAATAVIYGKCWRISYTLGGTNPGANFSIGGIEK